MNLGQVVKNKYFKTLYVNIVTGVRKDINRALGRIFLREKVEDIVSGILVIGYIGCKRNSCDLGVGQKVVEKKEGFKEYFTKT